MGIELSQLMRLSSGQIPVLTVGNLPPAVAQYLKAHPGIVFLRNHELKHIWQAHADISADDLLQLTLAVERGKYYADPKRRNCVTCIYINVLNGRPYVVGIKTASNGSETWISTYHRSNPRKVEARHGKWAYLCGPRAFRI
jgi:hypothetical protein